MRGRRREKPEEMYIALAGAMNEAHLKVVLRNALGGELTDAEENTLQSIHSIFFPEEEYSDEVKLRVLQRASSLMVDAWAGVPVAYLPSMKALLQVKKFVWQLRGIPLRNGKRSEE